MSRQREIIVKVASAGCIYVVRKCAHVVVVEKVSRRIRSIFQSLVYIYILSSVKLNRNVWANLN